MTDAERQTGRTTKQMEAAPQKAFFVWCNHAFAYPKDLARKLGRQDLQIVGPRDVHYMRGVSVPVVVDHAAVLTAEDSARIADHNAMVKP